MTTSTLLLVESPDRVSERYRQLARRAGYRVLTTHSGPMTRIVSQRSQPDLVLLTPLTGQPGSSQIARTLKEDPKTEHIPVMIVIAGDLLDPTRAPVYPTEACASDTASDDDLVSTMRALRSQRRVRPEPEPSSPLEGDLAEDTFPGVLEFLFAARKTGRVLVLDGGKWPGRIYLEDGNVTHAELMEQSGIEVFRRLCFLKRGRFKFEPEFRPAQRTMSENGMAILLESARTRDEQASTVGAKHALSHSASRL
ncbi:MAG TPA: DUF4388 domain-containing protein [Vicinamibacteria bacterium]|nr:DUF4388 domain-containing protein [Vicinamibacteria bacterium]